MKKWIHFISVLLIGLGMQGNAFTQGKPTYNIGIVVHEGVELFDFAGPGEVFAAAAYHNDVIDLNVFTVAPKKEAVTSQTFLSINPTYSIEDAPRIDVLVIPGGRTGVLLQDEAFMDWVKNRFTTTKNVLTVCTGAFVAAKLGLLDGLQATTHHGSIAYLRRDYPKVTVLDDVKFIDNGKVITSGGVSSGTEGALHMIHRLAGLQAAKEVARYMEYDHWSPEIGLTAYEKAPLNQLQEMALAHQNKEAFQKVLQTIDAGQADFGELEAVALNLQQKGKGEYSLAVYQRLRELFPWSIIPFEQSSRLLKAEGKKAPPTQEDFAKAIEEGGVDAANRLYDQWIAEFPDWKFFSESAVNSLGYRYISSKKYEEAISVFKLNTKAYPNSWNCWDSLAEAYMHTGDSSKAIKYYEKSLALNPENINAAKMIQKMQTAGLEK